MLPLVLLVWTESLSLAGSFSSLDRFVDRGSDRRSLTGTFSSLECIERGSESRKAIDLLLCSNDCPATGERCEVESAPLFGGT